MSPGATVQTRRVAPSDRLVTATGAGSVDVGAAVPRPDAVDAVDHDGVVGRRQVGERGPVPVVGGEAALDQRAVEQPQFAVGGGSQLVDARRSRGSGTRPACVAGWVSTSCGAGAALDLIFLDHPVVEDRRRERIALRQLGRQRRPFSGATRCLHLRRCLLDCRRLLGCGVSSGLAAFLIGRGPRRHRGRGRGR